MLKRVFATIILLTAACSTYVASEQNHAASNQGWEIKLIRSGGIAGNYRETVIHQNGLVTINRKKSAQPIIYRLTESERTRLNQAIQGINKGAQTTHTRFRSLPGSGRCRDCIVTTLVIRKHDGKVIKYNLDNGQQKNQPLAELLNLLADVTKKATTDTGRTKTDSNSKSN